LRVKRIVKNTKPNTVGGIQSPVTNLHKGDFAVRLLIAVAASLCSFVMFAADTLQITATPDGKRAFDDLALFYGDNKSTVPYAGAIKDLAGADAKSREKAGAYLLALLKQAFADESNGRAPVKRSPFFGGGGAQSDARVFRGTLSKAFAEGASGNEALPAALWLVNEEMLAPAQADGMKALCKIKSAQATDALRKVLQEPHPVEKVLAEALAEIALRGAKDATPDVALLCNHHRATIRTAARATITKIGGKEPPAFTPELGFSISLSARITKIAAMPALTEIPKDAKWARFKTAGDNGAQFSGWHLGEAPGGGIRALDWFGREVKLPVGTEATPIALADEAKTILEIRADDKQLTKLSRKGMGTLQFEPKFLSVPEALVGAWLFQRGDKATAASILFPRLEAMADDRWLGWVTRDLIGGALQQEMLEAFSHDRDYARATALAKHISSEPFDGYNYQDRAKKLAADLAKRADDFKTFSLPDMAKWEAQKKTLKRDAQIKYLAERMRLLNCIQMGQPGDVNYTDSQTAEAMGRFRTGKTTPVINPYNELTALKLQPADLPLLIPYLSDTQFLPTFSYWRDFHPKRTLHQANWAIVSIFNDSAKKNLADLRIIEGKDEAEKKAHLEAIASWCKENAGKTSEQLPDERPKRVAGGPRIDAP